MTPNERGPLETSLEHQPGLAENRLNLIQSGRKKLVQIMGRAGIAAMSVLAINCGGEEQPGNQPAQEIPVDGNPVPDNPQPFQIPEKDNTAPGAPIFENNHMMVGPEVEEVVFEGQVPNPEDTEKIQVSEDGGTTWEDVAYVPGSANFRITVPAPSNCLVQAVDAEKNESDPAELRVDQDSVGPEAPRLDQSPVMLGINDTSFTKMVTPPSDAATLVVYKGDEIVHALNVDGPQMATTVEFDPSIDPTGTYTVIAEDEHGNSSNGVSFEVNYEAPTMGEVEIDEVIGTGRTYPISVSVENATSYSVEIEIPEEYAGTDVSGGIIEDPNDGSIQGDSIDVNWIAGSRGIDVVIRIATEGPGGEVETSIERHIY